MNISLKGFTETGTLGKLHLGLAAEEVLHVLGSPDVGDVTFQDPKAGNLWQYGTFVLGFGDEYTYLDGLASIEWDAHAGEPLLLPDCTKDDWAITAEMKPLDVKTYLHNAGLKFRYRSHKGYFERQPVPASWRQRWPNVDEAVMAQNCSSLTFRKPKNEADIVSVMTFFTFFLLSGVKITFVDEQLQHIGVSSEV